MAGTSITKKAEFRGHGGVMQVWTTSINPASIAAAAQGIETVAIPGARAGDPCWANCEAVETQLHPVGAKVTANDVVSVYLNNGINATTAIDGAALTWTITIVKLTKAGMTDTTA
jgi:hypothetical protein